WKPVAGSLLGIKETGLKVMPLFKTGPQVAEEYRLMANEAFRSVKILENSGNTVKLLLTGDIKKNTIEQIIDLHKGQDYFHVEVSAILTKEPKLEYLLSSFTFMVPGEPDYTFVPSVKRADDDITGDRKFFAP